MNDRSEFQNRLAQDVQQGNITQRQGRQCLEAYDKRQSGEKGCLEMMLLLPFIGMYYMILGIILPAVKE